MKRFFPIGFIFLVVVIFFWQFLFKGLLPIPSDTIIGLYNPFRDYYAKDYPRGIPFKNFLITDPVRQQYPWKKLVISAEKKLQLPLWNPYNFAGTPLLANFQSGAFYPLNILFFIFPFNFSWGLLIFLSPLLCGLFTYFYLSQLRLSRTASLLGAISFAFCGFSIAWLEWGVIIHTALWFPLILLSIDKILDSRRNFSIWNLVLTAALSCSMFAGHLQTFFYVLLFSLFYLVFNLRESIKYKKLIFVALSLLIFIIITSIQWIPTLQFISRSARNADKIPWQTNGWFIPWQNLIQFIVPDFFGNPSTLNYFGVWNYGEFIGYVGIAPLVFALFSAIFVKNKKSFFFLGMLILSLIFALPTVVAKIPFQLGIPFISTAQPTRLIFIIDFSLSVLAALGFDYFLKTKKGIVYPLGISALLITSLWIYVIFVKSGLSLNDLSVVKHNLILPTLIFFIFFVISLLYSFIKYKNKKLFFKIFSILVILITAFDLLRFGLKFNSFNPNKYLFPSTTSIDFLQKNIGNYRVMEIDSRIMPPNFSAVYRIQTVDGYDPLYLLSFGKLIAASERNQPNIKSPFGFNRIIAPHNYSSPIINLLGVKYILSLTDIKSENFKKVFEEGQTQVYENKSVLPRAFFVKEVIIAQDDNKAVNLMFSNINSLRDKAIVNASIKEKEFGLGSVNILDYNPNIIHLETNNSTEGFLVLTDSFYPTWKASVDGKKTTIYQTDLNFRGIIIPKGIHKIEFYDSLF